jgi:hypothetical protein
MAKYFGGSYESFAKSTSATSESSSASWLVRMKQSAKKWFN